jgi:hypothetical protein
MSRKLTGFKLKINRKLIGQQEETPQNGASAIY